MVRVGLIPFAALAVWVASESPQAKESKPTARQKGDRAIQARSILRKYCFECHGGKESKGTITVMDHARLVASGPNPVPFVLPGDPAKSQIVQFIEDGSMPPGGRPRPTTDEIQALKAWIADDATHFPASFDSDATLKLVLADFAKHPDDAQYVRYLSFAHLIDDSSQSSLAKAEHDLFAALEHCGLTKKPTPIDPAGTLYRLDTRQAGWDSRELFVKETDDSEAAFPRLTPYDLLLLEYPLGETMTGAEAYLAAAKLARPIPLLRADWVTGMLKTDSPLVADLVSLTELHVARTKGMDSKMPCGPYPRPFGRLNPVPGLAKSQPRTLLPHFSWYIGDCQHTQPPVAITADLVDLNQKPLKSVQTGEEFQIRVVADRAAHFTLLNVWTTGKIAYLPTRANAFLEAKVNYLSPSEVGRDGFRIADILTGEKEGIEYFILLASTDPLPRPTIVRSRHSRGPNCEKQVRYPIYRFIFEPDAKFDPSKVVRKVIPVSVTAKKE